ncbi:MAG TPA: glycosyltransferase family 2 protein, partial [Planctomycetota bacterium]|nr:glycosyltransferase family 2 protein [Planctomycetota bacterium]
GRAVTRVRVVVPSWNVRDLLRECLTALAASRGVVLETLVVDDASADGSAAMVAREFPDVRLVALTRNGGFAAACNEGLRGWTGPYALLLNADTRVEPDAVAVLAAFLERNPRYAAAAPRLLHPDGRTQRACMAFPRPATALWHATPLERWFPASRELSRYFVRDFDHEGERDVEQPPAACLLLRRAALEELGPVPFDERLVLYFNDVDLSLRLARAGWRTRFLPAARVVHHVGASTRQVPERLLRWHLDRLGYFRKHHGRAAGLLLKATAVWSFTDFALRQWTGPLRGEAREPLGPVARSLGGLLLA